MKFPVRSTSAALAAFATAGVSSLFFGAAPASAATTACGDGFLVTGTTICEQDFTTTGGGQTFTPAPQTTSLQVLLVGGGGEGEGSVAVAGNPGTAGYAAGGGGGEVRLLDFSSDATAPISVTVGGENDASEVTTTATTPRTESAAGAVSGSFTGGGASGVPANTGGQVSDSAVPPTIYGGGGGAGGATTDINGGAGVVVSSLVSPATSLFAGDSRCFGGGGSVSMSGTAGLPGCGGGSPADADGTTLTPSIPNSGGGGGASLAAGNSSGAAGFVAFRWPAPLVTLTFSANGHGTAPASETIVEGTTPTKPADPVVSGQVFEGWFTDALGTTPADFSAPLTASTTFYAKWAPVLAATGGGANPAELPIGIAALAVGVGLFSVASIRRRRRTI